MYEVICYDSDGNSINYLTQWDLNRVLYIPLIEYSTMLNNAEVHFCNNKSEEALVQSTIIENGDTLIVSVPNELLQSSYPLIGHIYLTSPSANSFGTTTQKTVITFTLPVNERTRPSDYPYVDTGGTSTKSTSYDLVLQTQSRDMSSLSVSNISILSGSLSNITMKYRNGIMPKVLFKYEYVYDGAGYTRFYSEPSIRCQYGDNNNIYIKVDWFEPTTNSCNEHSFMLGSIGETAINSNRFTKIVHIK